MNEIILQIARLGTTGLAAAALFWTFRILAKEQNIERPRRPIIQTAKLYMVFALIICCVGLALDVVKYHFEKTAQDNNASVISASNLEILQLSTRVKICMEIVYDANMDGEVKRNILNNLSNIAQMPILAEKNESFGFSNYKKTFIKSTQAQVMSDGGVREMRFYDGNNAAIGRAKYKYDEAGLSKIWINQDNTVSTEVVSTGGASTYEYDSNGRLVTSVDSKGTTKYEYDEKGNLVRKDYYKQ